MKLKSIFAAVALMAGSALHAAEMPWAENYEAAQAKAKEEEKIIMIDFYTDWCTFCKQMDEETLSTEEVVKAAEKLVPVKVNAEEEGVELAQKYGVTGYPTIVFVDAEGEKIGTSVGFMPKEDFLPVITMATKVMERVPELKRTLATNPTVEAHLEMMEIAEFKTDWTLAAEHLTGAVALGHETENLSERYFLFGDNLVRASEFEKSLEIFDEALSHATADIDRAFALAGMAYANANLGNDEKATEYAAQILEIESDDPQIESLHEFAKQYVDES